MVMLEWFPSWILSLHCCLYGHRKARATCWKPVRPTSECSSQGEVGGTFKKFACTQTLVSHIPCYIHYGDLIFKRNLSTNSQVKLEGTLDIRAYHLLAHDSPPGTILSAPMGYLAWLGGGYWHLEGRDLGHCSPSNNAQDSLHSRELSGPKRS